MMNLKQLATQSLTHLREGGAQRLAVDEDARRILRGWMLQAKAGVHGQKPTAICAIPMDGEEAVLAAAEPHAGAMVSGIMTRQQAFPSPCGRTADFTPPAESPATHPAAHTEAGLQPVTPPGSVAATPFPKAPQSVEDKIAFLVAKAEHWPAVKRLGTLRSTMVFSTGNPHAKLMLVGEAPGHDEELQREPFVGPAGRKLNQILQAMGLTRQDVYISNICKFRPSMGENQGTANRAPTPEEIAACLPLILAEIRAIHPACIVCLGGCAAKGLLGTAASVGALRGSWLECQGIPVRVTYHPSYLLRTDTRKARRDVWEDMLAVMSLLGMPISKRQQNYFV